MNRLVWIGLAVMALTAPARAGAPSSSPSQGYLYFGSIKVSTREGKPLLLGGGLERGIRNGLTAAADLSYLYIHNQGFGMLSLGSGYHFGSWQSVTPFVNAGYGLALDGPDRNLFYFGGGLIRWFTPRVGARLEFRDHVSPGYCGCGTAAHFLQFRIGLAVR